MLAEELPKPFVAVHAYIAHAVEVSRGMVSVPVFGSMRRAPSSGTGWPLTVQVIMGAGTPLALHITCEVKIEVKREKKEIRKQCKKRRHIGQVFDERTQEENNKIKTLTYGYVILDMKQYACQQLRYHFREHVHK